MWPHYSYFHPSYRPAVSVLFLQVLEETGYDIEDLVVEEDFIELTLDGKRNKLYIVAGLDPDSAQFAPKCKGVSGRCCWGGICGDLAECRQEATLLFCQMRTTGLRTCVYGVASCG